MRPARVLAVIRRELRRSGSGRRGLSFAVVALVLLLPAGALRLPAAQPSDRPHVRGSLPEDLVPLVVLDDRAPVELVPGPPLLLKARALPASLRTLLDARDPQGPAVVLQLPPRAPLRLPDRALLIALLGISLLTGPLAETLPGEREARTLEVLLASSLSRGELILGKWACWTLVASAGGLLAGLSGMWTGALPAGPWLLAMPAALGLAVALGLYLVRGAGDLVGGAAAPMRILPVVALVSAGLALGLARSHPLLGAAVPMGGALLVSGGLLPGVGALAVALLGSGLASGGLLWATARSLDHQGLRTEGTGGGAWAPLLVGGLGWWLAVAGPGVFELGRAGSGLAPPSAAVAAGGLLLGLVAAVSLAREGRGPDLGRLRGLPIGAGVGLLFGLTGPWFPLRGPALLAPFQDRLALGLDPFALGLLPGLLVVLGQELLFRGALQRRLGLFVPAIAWMATVMPMDPARGLVLGLALGLLAARLGLLAALAAHLSWALLTFLRA